MNSLRTSLLTVAHHGNLIVAFWVLFLITLSVMKRGVAYVWILAESQPETELIFAEILWPHPGNS